MKQEPGYIGSTRADGKAQRWSVPPPTGDAYRFLVFLACLAAFAVEVFGTMVLIGIRRDAETRDSYFLSWPACCTAAAVATVAFCALVTAARRSKGRAVAIEARRKRTRSFELAAEAYWEETRIRYFGGRRVPLAVTLMPMLWTIPAFAADGVQQPADRATGQVEGSPVTIFAGVVLPVVVLLLWAYFSRLLTALGLAVWTAWAVCALAGWDSASAWAGCTGLAVVVGTAVATVAVRRRRMARAG